MPEATTVQLQEEMEASVERRIRQRTSGRVQRLPVAVSDGHLLVQGETTTYYVKQLALEAAREASKQSNMPLRIDIRVS